MILTSRTAATDPRDVAEYVSGTGVEVHFIEDRSVDPVVFRVVRTAPGYEEQVLYASTKNMSLFELMALLETLGYRAYYAKEI